MKKHKRFMIVVTERAPANVTYPGRFRYSDWRCWRRWSVLPLVFNCRKDADWYLHHIFTFKNMAPGKKSASVYPIGYGPWLLRRWETKK